MTSEATEIMEKLTNKKEYEVVASSYSSVNVDDIDNRIITEVLGPERALINLKRSQQRGKQSRAGQKVRRTLATASEYDEDVSAVAKSTILDI
ncbi:hypothetical protein Gotur_033981 [Gossypium turneri]